MWRYYSPEMISWGVDVYHIAWLRNVHWNPLQLHVFHARCASISTLVSYYCTYVSEPDVLPIVGNERYIEFVLLMTEKILSYLPQQWAAFSSNVSSCGICMRIPAVPLQTTLFHDTSLSPAACEVVPGNRSFILFQYWWRSNSAKCRRFNPFVD